LSKSGEVGVREASADSAAKCSSASEKEVGIQLLGARGGLQDRQDFAVQTAAVLQSSGLQLPMQFLRHVLDGYRSHGATSSDSIMES
jgi:hypothetical protein